MLRPAAWKKLCPSLDILYMTRVQRERFFNEEDYIRLKNSYVLTKDKAGSGPGRHGGAASPAPCE